VVLDDALQLLVFVLQLEDEQLVLVQAAFDLVEAFAHAQRRGLLLVDIHDCGWRSVVSAVLVVIVGDGIVVIVVTVVVGLLGSGVVMVGDALRDLSGGRVELL
jgi:hypothetical protein